MGDGQAKALGDYLKYNSPSLEAKRSGWRVTDKQVKKLAIDDAAISDQSLALILSGAYSQSTLKELSVANNPFAASCVDVLRQMFQP